MLGFVFNAPAGPHAKAELVAVGDAKAMDDAYGRERVKYRHDLKSFEQAEVWAKDATELTGKLHLPVDKGGGHYPRFDVTEVPALGDKVSYAFNGDYYPDGEVTYVTPKTAFMVKTSTGNVYRRSGKSATWYQTGGTWMLVSGHIDRRNPSF